MSRLHVGIAAGVLSLALAPVLAQPTSTPGNRPKATICFSYNLAKSSTQLPSLNCDSLGSVANLAELYEKGYRVVSSGILSEQYPGGVTTRMLYFVVELRDLK